MKRGFAAQFGERLKFLSPQQATGYFGIFTTAHRTVVPHFRFKKDLILYLNSALQAAGNSNLNMIYYINTILKLLNNNFYPDILRFLLENIWQTSIRYLHFAFFSKIVFI